MMLGDATAATPTFHQWRNTQVSLSRLECDLLLAHVMQMSRSQILARPEQTLDERQLSRLQRLSQQLVEGTPLAYILGEREFYGLSMLVNPAVLVPRPETELLVDVALQRLRPGDRVLDAGTGSGAIAVALANSQPRVDVDASDLSDSALKVGKANARRHNVAVNFLQSDWFENLTGSCWDIIVSNPPYIAASDPHLAALHAEPAEALIADDDGFADLSELIANSPACLNTGGWLMLEHGYNQAVPVREAMLARGFTDVCSFTDLGNIERVSQGRFV